VPERSGQRPVRAGRRSGPSKRNGRPANSPRGGPETLRERLRRDNFLFTLCLVGLGILTWACALVWWVIGGLLPLALAVASIAPAVYLFYLRDG
jgi:hypothetical protein